MELEEIRKIIELMDEKNLNEFEFQQDGKRISIKKGQSGPMLHTVQAVAPPSAAAVPPDQSAALVPEGPSADQANIVEIKAPFVGTFYRASSPESESYVDEGQEVSPDTVLCIVEAMKVMNEIKAETRGVVRAILVENAHAVQYGQPLFKIEKI